MTQLRSLDTGIRLLAIGGIIFLVVCVSTNHWRSREGRHEGLWQKCTSSKSHWSCTKVYTSADSCVPAKMAGVIAMMLLCLILLAFGFILSIVSMVMRRSFGGAIIVLTLIAVCACVAGLSIYTRYFDDDYYDLSWSYALGWVGCILLFISACLSISTLIK